MRIKEAESSTVSAAPPESRNTANLFAQSAGGEVPEFCPRIALLTPYTGGNLGDAAIQDAMITNMRLRLPGAEFSGICHNCDNFLEQHGSDAFPMTATSIPFFSMCAGKVAGRPGYGESKTSGSRENALTFTRIKKALKGVPLLGGCLKAIYACWREFRHLVKGYSFLRAHDLLIVSGGGQMNEQCGGPWGQPFALFKWAILARIAQIPFVIASVGVGRATSRTSRLFLWVALRMAAYRSYRDTMSRAFATSLVQCASRDPVVPDLAFSLPTSEIPSPAHIRAVAQGRTVVAISPIIYANPSVWPSTWYQDRALYDRYVDEMARVVCQLLDRNYFLVLVYSSLGDDQRVIPELLQRLGEESKKRLTRQTYIPTIATWRDLVASLRDVDFLIASRLHSGILGLIARTPLVAISFDPKVDRMMEDLGQTDYLLQIRDFAAEDVIQALDRLMFRRESPVQQIVSYLHRSAPLFGEQYDAIARLASVGHRCRNRWNKA